MNDSGNDSEKLIGELQSELAQVKEQLVVLKYARNSRAIEQGRAALVAELDKIVEDYRNVEDVVPIRVVETIRDRFKNG